MQEITRCGINSLECYEITYQRGFELKAGIVYFVDNRSAGTVELTCLGADAIVSEAMERLVIAIERVAAQSIGVGVTRAEEMPKGLIDTRI